MTKEMLKIDGIQGDEELIKWRTHGASAQRGEESGSASSETRASLSNKESYEAVRGGGSDEVEEVVRDFQNFPKLLAAVRIGIVDGLEYRFQLTYWLYLNMIPILLMFYLWTTVYQEKEMLGKYTLNMMMTYYILTKLINRFTTTYSEGRIAKDIKDGNLNQFLTRPANYSILKFGERLGIRVVNAMIFIPLYALIIVLLQKYFVMPESVSALALITGNIAISIISTFLMARILGFTAFFMLETHALFGLKDHIISLLSGFMFPLFLFPQWMEKILMLLPFPYYYYFAMEIYFGHLGTQQIIHGFIIQIVWIFILFFLGELLWKKGIKNYESVGI